MKTLESAIANAENNNNADIDKLLIKSIIVNQGMRLKESALEQEEELDRSQPCCTLGISSRMEKHNGTEVHPIGMRLGIIKVTIQIAAKVKNILNS